jgi:hypothetical protein
VTRLSVIFEEKGHEIKRLSLDSWRDGDRHWNIDDLRCDIYFKLVNHKTSDGRSSISYEVEKVEFLAVVDFLLLPERADEWISDKVRPRIEKEIKEVLNQENFRRLVADEVQQKLDDLVKAASEYADYGYILSALVPKQVAISGNSVVFRFT